MYTAYLDETGQQTNSWIFVAGFVGNDAHWNDFVPQWKAGLGNRRKFHMNELRWKNHRTKKLLERLGRIPVSCGLHAVAGGVNYGDYEELLEGSIVEKLSKGYLWSLFPLVLCLLKWLPPDERVELVFGAQDRYRERANDLLSFIAKETKGDNRFCTAEGLSKLAKWTFLPPGDNPVMLHPADYYAYALANYHQDRHSQRAQMCMPIMNIENNMPYIGRILSRDEIRGQVTRGRQTLLDHGIQFYEW